MNFKFTVRIRRKVRERTFFTLTELLVVIAMLSILVSLLQPSLSKALDLAITQGCLKKQSAIGLANQLFAEDFDQRLPPAEASISDHNLSWAQLFAKNGYIAHRYRYTLAPDPKDNPPTPDTDSALVCPNTSNFRNPSAGDGYNRENINPSSDWGVKRWARVTWALDSSYCINGSNFYSGWWFVYNMEQYPFVHADGTNIYAKRKIFSIPNPYKFVALWDGVGPFNPWNNSSGRISGQRHGSSNQQSGSNEYTGKINLLFIDGHAKTADRIDCPKSSPYWASYDFRQITPDYQWSLSQ